MDRFPLHTIAGASCDKAYTAYINNLFALVQPILKDVLKVPPRACSRHAGAGTVVPALTCLIDVGYVLKTGSIQGARWMTQADAEAILRESCHFLEEDVQRLRALRAQAGHELHSNLECIFVTHNWFLDRTKIQPACCQSRERLC